MKNFDDDNYHTCNRGFFDLPPEERAAWYDKARRDTGVENFFDLSPEERGRYYDKAAGYED